MREKLIELVKRAITDWEHGDVSERIADHLIKNGVTIQSWIPVTERLPDGECIALGFQNEMLIGYIGESECSNTGYVAEYDDVLLYDVTHWMPLPEPPKEEDQ